MKKCFVLVLTLAMLCAGFALAEEINVISREEGSGTRSAFTELFEIEVDGVDATTEDADITNSTSVMMTSVSDNPAAIGYISLGSLNETVKALPIDGVDATVANIKSGDYAISRPFNIATGAEVSEAAQNFIDFILSAEGQAIVEENGYIATIESAPDFEGSKVAGKVVVAGSSSVTPIMEKLSEAYLAINPNADIEVQQSDSTAGMSAVKDGVCDIGMASRALKESEIEAGLASTTIAMDGIAVIVSNDNAAMGLSKDQVRAIYMGEITTWEEIN